MAHHVQQMSPIDVYDDCVNITTVDDIDVDLDMDWGSEKFPLDLYEPRDELTESGPVGDVFFYELAPAEEGTVPLHSSVARWSGPKSIPVICPTETSHPSVS
jgi:hypothetical protein